MKGCPLSSPPWPQMATRGRPWNCSGSPEFREEEAFRTGLSAPKFTAAAAGSLRAAPSELRPEPPLPAPRRCSRAPPPTALSGLHPPPQDGLVCLSLVGLGSLETPYWFRQAGGSRLAPGCSGVDWSARSIHPHSHAPTCKHLLSTCRRAGGARSGEAEEGGGRRAEGR